MPEGLMQGFETIYAMMKQGPTTLGFTKDGRAVVSYVVIDDGHPPRLIPIGELLMPVGRPVEE